jgi:hypothetical protein
MNDYKNTEMPSPTDWHNSRLMESGLFLLIIFIEAAIFFYLIQGRLIVGGHDGFQYFSVQYNFLTNVIYYSEIPQWSPFMAHGSMAILGYITPNGILQNILFLSGSLFKDINFLPLFYAGIFLDELLLLAGVWLLGRRFFASPFTVFFVTLSIMGSCIWILQPWWNFHLYYAIPLILYLIHVFIDSGKWRYYFLAGNLLFMQCLGNLPYFLPVTSLVIFLYFLFYFIFNFENTWQKIKALNFRWPFVITTSLIIISFIALQIIMTIGMDQVVNYNALRNMDGTTTLDGFLTYGRIFTWRAWLELILGISPFLDYNLYIGILCVPFILLGLILNLNKQNSHFLLTVIILLLFSMGNIVSVFFYYSWPMMKFFRHLALVSPIIKVLLCFLAGLGFDAVFFNKSRWKNPFIVKVLLISSSLLMLGISLFLWIMSHNYEFCVHLLKNMAPTGMETLPFFTTIFDEDILIPLLGHTTLFALIAFVLFAVMSFVQQKKYFLILAVLLSALHCADIYGFKFSEIKLKTTELNGELSKIIDFQPMPYAKRRDISFWNNNPRAELLKILPVQEPAVLYSTTNAFVFKDEISNQFRNDFWLLPFDNYMRAYWGQSNHDLSTKPTALSFGFRMEFPQGHPAALKISGVTEDKIQLFSQAYLVSSDDSIAALITDADYKGDIIFLSPLKNLQETSSVSSGHNLSSDKRLRLPYQVGQFDANNIEITTNINGNESAWLLYSDVWHPLWRATVNGKETPVYKANLAYKAVKLDKGVNKIHFFFKSKLIAALYFIFNLNALCWFIIIIYLIGKITFNTKKYRWSS